MNAVQKEIADTLSKHPTWSRSKGKKSSSGSSGRVTESCLG